MTVSFEGFDVSLTGAAVIADLGGSSKYSGEQPGDVRFGSGFYVNSDWT